MEVGHGMSAISMLTRVRVTSLKVEAGIELSRRLAVGFDFTGLNVCWLDT